MARSVTSSELIFEVPSHKTPIRESRTSLELTQSSINPLPPRTSIAPVATVILSRQERNFSSGVRMRVSIAPRSSPASASSNCWPTNMTMERTCSVGTMIFISWRRSKGLAMIFSPNAMRARATTSASFRQRRIMAAARTPWDRRDIFTWSIINFRPLLVPRPTSPRG